MFSPQARDSDRSGNPGVATLRRDEELQRRARAAGIAQSWL